MDNHNLPIDTATAWEFLRLLGYNTGDQVSLRSFPAKNAPKGGGINSEHSLPDLPTSQRPDRALYVVPNGPGQNDEAITTGRAFFNESDDGTRETQAARLQQFCQEFGLPQPNFQVQTRHSTHSYWIPSERPPIAEWLELQSRLLFWSGADPNVGNASRVMRLAGAWHTELDKETGTYLEPFPCTLIQIHDQPIDLDLLRALPPIPEDAPQKQHTDKGERTYNKFQQPTLIQLIKAEEKRRQSADDPASLFDWDGHNFSPRGDGIEWDGCCPWHDSTSGTSFSATWLGDHWEWFCRGCQVGGDWISYQYALQKGYPAGSPKGRDAYDLARALVQPDVELPPPGQSSKSRASAQESIEDEELHKDLDAMAAKRRHRLAVDDVAPHEVASILKGIGQELGIAPGLLFTGLLPVLASLAPTNTRIVAGAIVEKPIWWQGWVADSGTKKSPAMRMLTGFLSKLQSEEWKAYQRRLESDEGFPDGGYDEVHVEQPKKRGKAKTVAPQRHYLSTDPTVEALARLAGDNGSKGGVLLKYDELAQLFNGLNQYKSGKGSDSEKLLSLYDGDSIKIDRVKAEDSRFVESTSFSILGGVQPEVLQRLMVNGDGELTDDNGMWARFEFAHLEDRIHPLALKRSNGDVKLGEILSRIRELIANEYIVEGEALKLFAHYHDTELEPTRFGASGGAKNYQSKRKGRLARLVLLLHFLDAAAMNTKPSLAITDPKTVQRAITLSEWFVGQVGRIHQSVAASRGEVAPTLQSILDVLASAPEQWWTARDIQRKVRVGCLRSLKADELRGHMNKLVGLKRVQSQGEGTKLKIRFVTTCHQFVTNDGDNKNLVSDYCLRDLEEFVTIVTNSSSVAELEQNGQRADVSDDPWIEIVTTSPESGDNGDKLAETQSGQGDSLSPRVVTGGDNGDKPAKAQTKPPSADALRQGSSVPPPPGKATPTLSLNSIPRGSACVVWSADALQWLPGRYLSLKNGSALIQLVDGRQVSVKDRSQIFWYMPEFELSSRLSFPKR